MEHSVTYVIKRIGYFIIASIAFTPIHATAQSYAPPGKEPKYQSINHPFSYKYSNRTIGGRVSYYHLADDLSNMVPVPTDINCKYDLEYFVFRVNAKGDIDFLKSFGTVTPEIRSKIKSNIYALKGKFVLPKKKSPHQFHWFVYLFTSHGENDAQPCPNQGEIKKMGENALTMINLEYLLRQILPDLPDYTFIVGGHTLKRDSLKAQTNIKP